MVSSMGKIKLKSKDRCVQKKGFGNKMLPKPLSFEKKHFCYIAEKKHSLEEVFRNLFKIIPQNKSKAIII